MKTESKYGITLEKYAELIVKTINANEDDEAYNKIIENEGITLNDWKKAKKEWDNKISDPNDEGKTSSLFLPLYNKALENNNIGRGPCSLEEFTKIHCELSFRREQGDPLKPIKYETVLKENGLSVNNWELCNSFWIVRVGMPNYRKKFSELVKKYSQNQTNIMFGNVS